MSVSGVFCDYLRVTHPPESSYPVWRALGPLLGGAGMECGKDGSYRTPDGGLVTRLEFSRVSVISASGAALVALRAAKLYGQYLQTLGGEPHRVTLLHATMDEFGGDPPGFLQQLYRHAKSPGIRLSRKRAPVHWYGGVDRDGRDTGTVWLGARRARVRLCVYDKRQERLDHGAEDPGCPVLRRELEVRRDVGATLRDAWDPTALFWHFMPADVAAPPVGVPLWEPHGEGFDIPVADERDPADVLQSRLNYSRELAEIVRHALLVPGGLVRLQQRITRLVSEASPTVVA